MKIRSYSEEDIYSLTLRAYGDLQALSQFIDHVENLDDFVPPVTEFDFDENLKLPKYVKPTDPFPRRQTVDYLVKSDQSPFDLAVQLGGTLDQLPEIISNFESLEDDLQGQKITITESLDVRRQAIIQRGYTFATARLLDQIVDDWILATGFWNDDGFWRDTSFWID